MVAIDEKNKFLLKSCLGFICNFNMQWLLNSGHLSLQPVWVIIPSRTGSRMHWRLENAILHCHQCHMLYGGPNTLEQEEQTRFTVDVICLENTNFPHIIDRVTSGCKFGRLSLRSIDERVKVMKSTQIQCHGVRRTILADREYSKGDVWAFWIDQEIQLTETNAY